MFFLYWCIIGMIFIVVLDRMFTIKKGEMD